MGTYWGYKQDGYKWYAYYYIEGKVKIKLGPFFTIWEAQEAAEKHGI